MDSSKITQLGQRIAQRMSTADYHSEELSRVASDALAEAELEPTLDLAELAVLAVQAPRLGRGTVQTADVQLPLFVSDDFIVELRAWTQGDAVAREQGWWGAYQVLRGSGVRTLFHFEPQRRINAHLRTGALVPTSCELLVAGDVRPVHAGPDRPFDDFVPLDSPTAALVVRARGLESRSPTVHFRPSLALAEEEAAHDRLVTEALKCTEVAERLADPELLMRTMGAALDELDRFRGAYVALSTSVRPGESRARFLEEVPPRFGDLEDELRSALQWSWRARDCARLRERVKAPTLRFVLGAYASAPDRDALRAVVHARYPGVDPFELLVEQVAALVDDGDLSVSWDPEAPEEGLLRSFLRGESVTQALDPSRHVGASGRASVVEAFELMAEDPVLSTIRPIAARLS